MSKASLNISLVREHPERGAGQKLEALLIDGLNSGDPVPICPDSWERKRERLVERQARRSILS